MRGFDYLPPPPRVGCSIQAQSGSAMGAARLLVFAGSDVLGAHGPEIFPRHIE